MEVRYNKDDDEGKEDHERGDRGGRVPHLVFRLLFTHIQKHADQQPEQSPGKYSQECIAE